MKRANRAAVAAREFVAAIAISLALAACGGGGSDAPPPTPLPATLTLTLPATQQALGAMIAFASNAVDPGNALRYQWDFGDGNNSSLASPRHAYAKAGAYTVRLTVSNDAGASVSSTSSVAVADLAVVQGKACSAADSKGWCWQRPLPQGNLIGDYAFVSDTQAWAIGDTGTLLATTDGGSSWQPQATGTELDLLKLAFVDARVGWVASTNGTLLKTADGGTTWQPVSFGREESVMTLGAADANVAWITTNGGAAYVTADGGASWKQITGPNGNPARMFVASRSKVWAAPYGFTSSPLAHSLDGGVTWQDVSLPAPSPGLSRGIFDVQVAGPLHALLVTNESGYDSATQNYISRDVTWRTADGGTTWQAITPPPNVFNFYNSSFQFVDANTIFVGPTGVTPVQRSTDGGTSWQAIAMPTLASYYVSFKAFSAQRLIVTDGERRVYLSTDGGASWQQRGAGGSAAVSLNSVWFFDNREGLAIGSDGSSVRTSDGGQTWVTTAPISFQGWRRAQFLAGGSKGWVISDAGTIFLSTDKGKAWLSPVAQTSAQMFGVTDFHFVDANRGWAVAPFSYSSQASLFSSTDGGSSWQAIAGTGSLSGLVALRFADASHGVAVGPAGFAMLTADGGVTWAPRATGIDRRLRRITFVDVTTAVAVGDSGVIVRSTDQGQTWRKIASPTLNGLNDVHFVSVTTGYAVGEAGSVLRTRDGGLTWTLLASRTRLNLQSVFFTDAQTGWLVGDNGSILATVSGGD